MKKRFHNGIKKSKKEQRKFKMNNIAKENNEQLERNNKKESKKENKLKENKRNNKLKENKRNNEKEEIKKENSKFKKENNEQLERNNNFSKKEIKFEPIKKNSEENKTENTKFKKEYKKSAIQQPKECYLRGKLVTKEELRSLNTILKSDNINLDELVNLLESLFERIFDNKNNEPITLREKTGLIEESLKIFELKKSKKYILLRLKVLELLILKQINTFIPLSLEIVKIIEEILNHEPCLENKHITGYKINEEKWSEEINNQLFKKILRVAYKYFNKHSNCLGFVDLVFYFENKFKECGNEEIKGLIKIIGLHKEYLEKNIESNAFLRMEEMK